GRVELSKWSQHDYQLHPSCGGDHAVSEE
ncbi:hypothetical protein NPIL_207361, partial [Nephila pilipes]